MSSLLLDTNVLLPMLEDEVERLPDGVRTALNAPQHLLFASVASLWEASIKHRLGRLPLIVLPAEWPEALEEMRVRMFGIAAAHATTEVEPWPATKDPFDRLLLAVCKVEGLRLVTLDGELVGHPLAWRASA